MVLGSAGAFILYVALQWPGLFDHDLVTKITGTGNDQVFLLFGIASGFSERLFVGALEKISDKLSVNSEDRQLENENGKCEQ